MLKHLDGRNVTVPNHGSDDLDRGFARKLLRQAEVSVSDFLAAL